MTQDLLLLSYEENVYSTLYQRLSCGLQFVVLFFQCKAAPSTAPHMGPARCLSLEVEIDTSRHWTGNLARLHWFQLRSLEACDGGF